jgi:hypothetical protein
MLAIRVPRSKVIVMLIGGTIAAALIAVLLGSKLGATAAAAGVNRAAGAAATPAADCQPFGTAPCLLPFPNNLFTRPDRSTPTGVRVNLPAAAMPVNTMGQQISVAEYDRNDGFSPGSALIVHVPGLDNSQAFAQTGAVGLANMAQTFAQRQPIVVIDAATGRRQLIWSELDANASDPQSTNLLIHPGKNFTEGHTYIVALRRLRNAAGKKIAAPDWFERLRDGRSLPPNERSQRARYARIFLALKRAGIGRGSLYEAWDFTIASRQSLTSRLLAIRNGAFAQLGDHNLADSRVQGRAPSFAVTSTGSLTPTLRQVTGTFSVPCYLVTCGASATTGFNYSSPGLDALPTQISGNVATAPFECIIPSTAGNPSPARISLYGHGLLGSHREVEAGNVEAMATEHNMVFCATDWWGLAEGDVPNDVTALNDLNHFPSVVDRLQQGVLNTLFLGRVMHNANGFASNPAFQVSGHSALDTPHLYYDGNSQGGIEGGMTTAVAPDLRHAVLGVSGMNYGNVLVTRSTDFSAYGQILYGSYPDTSMHPVILDLIQQLWDRGDPDGYAQQMTSNPLPDTPSHQVLMQIAYGDHQVSMYAAAVEARTIGAFAHQPALDLGTNRSQDRNLFFGVPAIGHYPFHGSAIVIWDSGPGRVQPPPLTNTPPADTATSNDPHEDVRNTPAARSQKSDFLQPHGAVVDVCQGNPCHTSAYMP